MRPADERGNGAFALRVAIAGSGGQFSDGYILGIIGVTLSSAASELALTPLWLALLGAASLAGLFFGALAAGPIVDRCGRRLIFASDMPVFCVLSACQFFVVSAPQLLILRLLLGVTLGADYVTAKALVMEHCPGRQRARFLSILAIAWATGYGASYFVGYAVHGLGSHDWRWMLLSSAVPAALISPFRVWVPESPLWRRPLPRTTLSDSWRLLLSPALRQRSFIACLFYTCQVIPFFAVGTFIPRVLAALHVHDSYSGGLIYSAFLLAGSIVGVTVVDRLSRRAFLVGSFYACGIILAWLTLQTPTSPHEIVGLFAGFSAILAAAANLEYVYTPELFPTELRGAGVGLAVAVSRIGAASGTFLLPLVAQRCGIHVALVSCVAVLMVGGFCCQVWAPETREVRML